MSEVPAGCREMNAFPPLARESLASPGLSADMVDADAESSLGGLHHLLQNGLDLWTELFTQSRGKPVSDSPATQELMAEATLRGEWGEDPVGQVLAHVQTLSLIAQDQTVGLLALFRAGSPYAPITISRAPTEAFSRAWWLLDPAIDARARVARGMNERLESLRSSRHFLRPCARDSIP